MSKLEFITINFYIVKADKVENNGYTENTSASVLFKVLASA